MSETKNAKIINTFMGIEDHGIFTFSLTLDYGGPQQGYGMYYLDVHDEETKTRKSHPASIVALRKIIEVVGVRSWEDLKGKHVRVKGGGHSGPVESIGNFLKDDWVNVGELFKEYK